MRGEAIHWWKEKEKMKNKNQWSSKYYTKNWKIEQHEPYWKRRWWTLEG